MKNLLTILFLVPLLATAADTQIIAKIAVTNSPTTNGQTLVIDGGATRTWTNNWTGTPATSILTNTTAAGSATNLWTALARTPASARHIYTVSGTNVFIRAGVNQSIAVTVAGEWGTVTYSTNSTTNAFVFRVPMETENDTNRTNIASMAVSGLSLYSTQAFATNATALSNFLTAGPNVQRGSNKTFEASVFTGGGVSNSYFTNITRINSASLVATTATIYAIANTVTGVSLETPKLTNFTGRGTGLFVSNVIGIDVTLTNLAAPGSGTRSLRIGSSSAASNDDTIALGTSTTSSGVGSIAVGNGSVASNAASISIGTTALTKGDGGIAIGTASATNYAVAIGDSSEALYSFSTAIGTLAIATTNNQVRIGTADEHVSIPGQLRAANQTNSVFLGTNNWNGDVAYNAHAYSSLVNSPTVNSAIPIGTNYYADLSGATAIADIHSFENRRIGYTFTAVFSGHITNRLIHNSGSEATAAMRINTGTGANISQTNQPAWARFRKRSGDWLLLEYSN